MAKKQTNKKPTKGGAARKRPPSRTVPYLSTESKANPSTTMRVLRSTRNRLHAYGRKGESTDELITRLLDVIDEKEIKETIRQTKK